MALLVALLGEVLVGLCHSGEVAVAPQGASDRCVLSSALALHSRARCDTARLQGAPRVQYKTGVNIKAADRGAVTVRGGRGGARSQWGGGRPKVTCLLCILLEIVNNWCCLFT